MNNYYGSSHTYSPMFLSTNGIQQSISFGGKYTVRESTSATAVLINYHCEIIKQKSKTISKRELIDLLDTIQREIKLFPNECHIKNFNNILSALVLIRPSTLSAVAKHKFFSLLQVSYTETIEGWFQTCKITEKQSILFRILTKFLKIIFKKMKSIDFNPSWLFSSSFINMISSNLTDLSKSERYFFIKNENELKSFTQLFDIFIDYQSQLNKTNNSNKDALFQFAGPIIRCLCSNYYIDCFDMKETNKNTLTTKDQFFLIQCPSFIITYKGGRIEQLINSLLTAMLPEYITLLNKLIPFVFQWSKPTFEAINCLLMLVNHKSANLKVFIDRTTIVDHILTLIDTPILYNNLQDTLSNEETNMINTSINFLLRLVKEPILLNYVKQKKITSSICRLISAQYEPLKSDIHMLLAYLVTDDDIKLMPNPGVLITTIYKSLKILVREEPNEKIQIQQYFEILKNLVQHDQLKESLVKRHGIPFLLECLKSCTETASVTVLEILWSLSFLSEAATILRENTEFLERIETQAQSSNNEEIKKACQGLIWKLVQEPALLEKIAKQQQENSDNEVETEIVIGSDGQEHTVTKKKSANIDDADRVFQYDMMISYCHADKDIVYKIHEYLLDQGFKIWIDLNNMFGPVMNAMAEAVENSEFVILCMSDSYKQSTYCQAEAEYAFNCKRRLLPLIVRPDYKPDGWLGFMIGSRIYVDFGLFDFSTACDRLLNEISRQRKRPLPSPTDKLRGHGNPTAKASEEPPTNGTLEEKYTKRDVATNFKMKNVKAWTESDVVDFLFDQQLNELIPMCEKMDGPSLIQLYKMCASQTNETYALLNAELKATQQIKLPIRIYTRFLSIMERITEPKPPPIYIPSIYDELATNPNNKLPNLLPYDIMVTSSASANHVIKMVDMAFPKQNKTHVEYWQ